MKKAWIVSDGNFGDGDSCVVFADTRNAARKMAQFYLDCGYMEITATRAKQYDQYVEHDEVPCQVLIEDGWRFSCEGDYCNRIDNVDQDAIDHDGARIIEGKPYCGKCAAEINKLRDIEKEDDDDPCQPCHNALCCLQASQNGARAKCIHWDYFKRYYASGLKKIIGDDGGTDD